MNIHPNRPVGPTSTNHGEGAERPDTEKRPPSEPTHSSQRPNSSKLTNRYLMGGANLTSPATAAQLQQAQEALDYLAALFPGNIPVKQLIDQYEGSLAAGTLNLNELIDALESMRSTFPDEVALNTAIELLTDPDNAHIHMAQQAIADIEANFSTLSDAEKGDMGLLLAKYRIGLKQRTLNLEDFKKEIDIYKLTHKLSDSTKTLLDRTISYLGPRTDPPHPDFNEAMKAIEHIEKDRWLYETPGIPKLIEKFRKELAYGTFNLAAWKKEFALLTTHYPLDDNEKSKVNFAISLMVSIDKSEATRGKQMIEKLEEIVRQLAKSSEPQHQANYKELSQILAKYKTAQGKGTLSIKDFQAEIQAYIDFNTVSPALMDQLERIIGLPFYPTRIKDAMAEIDKIIPVADRDAAYYDLNLKVQPVPQFTSFKEFRIAVQAYLDSHPNLSPAIREAVANTVGA